LVCAIIRRSSQVTGELSESDLIQALSSSASQGGSKRILRYTYSIATILIVIMLILTSLNLFRHITRGPAIGKLTGAYEIQWRGSRPRPGEPLYAGSYNLRGGVAKMELGKGTSLLLEAPCQVKLVSVGEMILKSGRVSVLVPSQAKGFQVRTPTATITDLGTEFGVITYPDGSTETHVFKGHINITIDPSKTGRPTSLLVNEGQASAVNATRRTIRGGLTARADLFLLQLPPPRQPASPLERLNLADIVGGGNGRGTGTLDHGINLGTGQAFKHPADAVKLPQRNVFRPTPQFHGIDGVFVPNGTSGKVVISSTGLTFSQCPQTAGSYYGGPVNSGKFCRIETQQTFVARLNGIDYGTSKHPALNLHPNAGITFDLDQIRQDNPHIQIDRFTAVCGIPKNLPHVQVNAADVWILLDGVVSLHLNYPTERYVIEKVDVPIPTQTRFLTLISTCPGDAGYSWIFFGDPFLGLAATVQEEITP